MIDWGRLRPYNSTTHRSFEEFCYHVTEILYGNQSTLTSIDDSGGGDGVEFYLTWPNGDEWGWQAKWYYPNSRLDDSRRRSIRQSLKRACERHPRMTRWFLCTPTNLTPGTGGEQNWFDSTLPTTIPAGHPARIEHWGESFFISRLADPRFVGTRIYFFGDLELSLEWFTKQFARELDIVREKYVASLHTETVIDARLHAILGDPTFVARLEEQLAALDEMLRAVEAAVVRLRGSRLGGEAWLEATGRLGEVLDRMIGTFREVRSRLYRARDLLGTGDIDGVRRLEWNDLWLQLETDFAAYREDSATGDPSPLLAPEGDDEHTPTLSSALRLLQAPYSLATDLITAARECAAELDHLRLSEVHVLGGAGFGKTHFACHTCRVRLDCGVPALLVLGVHFASDRPLTEQLRTILDIPPTYRVDDFLQALSTAAQVYRTRLPIVIDGLNEATESGAFSGVWQRDLAAFVGDIARSTGLVLVTTSRETYRAWIWPDGHPPHSMHARGFGPDTVEEAMARYFDAYKIVADITAAPLEQFEHPIYLRIFCESRNPERREEAHTYVGEHTLFEVFASYLSQCNRRVGNRLRQPPTARIVEPALRRVAEALWQGRSRMLLLDDAVLLIDGKARDQIEDWTRSRTHAIQDEGLLVCRDLFGPDEVLFFAYDLLAGYLIADHLIAAGGDDVAAYLTQPDLVAALFDGDYSRRHPLSEDIGRCLAALLPARTGRYLHDVVPGEIPFNLSIKALFEMDPQTVNQDCVDLIGHLFKKKSNRQPLLDLASTTVGHVSHPLNMDFWHGRLASLSMVERDASWTEQVRQRALRLEADVLRFEDHCRGTAQPDAEAVRRLHLLARHTLCCSPRPCGSCATRPHVRSIGMGGAGRPICSHCSPTVWTSTTRTSRSGY